MKSRFNKPRCRAHSWPTPFSAGMVGLVILLIPTLTAGIATASESILFNGSPAYDCYRSASNDPHPSDLDDCDLAISAQTLSTAELAATYSNRGVIYGRIGDIRQSMKDHNRAAELAPDLPNVYVNRANVFTRLKQYQAALDDLDQAIRLGGEVAPIAYYNRALLHQSLGNAEAARVDAETAAALSPETVEYQQLRDQLGVEPAEG